MEKEYAENYLNLKNKKLYKQDSIIFKMLSKFINCF